MYMKGVWPPMQLLSQTNFIAGGREHSYIELMPVFALARPSLPTKLAFVLNLFFG
jgi:hypothetical protein